MCIVIYMKSSKRDQTYVQRKNGGKKSGEKAVKLDRKSSRGMIYENEELRLRTININAEVERGQSDIRKLRRENEQLRREIWSLRDEYDRLNKRFKANKYLPDSISEHGQSESNSEDSDSCDTCRGEGDINEECLGEHREHENFPPLPARQQHDRCPLEGSACRGETFNEQGISTTAPETSDNSTPTKSRDHLHVNFDHLSIVSEENLSNSDGNLTQQSEANHQVIIQPQAHHNFYYDENSLDVDGSRLSPSQCMGAMSLPRLVGPLTPMTPIEMVANELNDLQSIVPPLSYFENIVQQHMGTTITSISDSNASTNTGETVIHTNGWDYNIQSPFAQRKFQSSDPSSSNSTSTTMSPSHLSNPVSAREGTPQPDASTNSNVSNPDGAYKNLKHFFSPIKPRLRLDTALAARAATLGPSAGQYLEHLHQKCDPPDVYITNALASPYYPQPIAGLSLPVLVPPIQQPYIEPIYATAQKKPHSSEQSLRATESSKSSVNLEQILNEIGTISEDILQMQLEKSKSQEKLITESNFFTSPTTTSISATATPLHTATTHTQTLSSTSSPINFQKEQQHQNMPSDKNRKPYRSEMNLLLSYNGPNTVIIPIANNSTATGSGVSTSEAAQVLVVDKGTTDRDGNSPSPPQLPTPMAPFPTNLMYLGFDRLNQSLNDSGEALYPVGSVGPPFIPPSSLEISHQHVSSPQPPSPLPPPSFPDCERNEDPGVLRQRDQDALNPALAISSPDLSTSPLSGVNLATIIPLKRRIFSKLNDDGKSSQLTRSFDAVDVTTVASDAKPQPPLSLAEEVKSKLLLEGSTNEISSYESSSGSEATKRKPSRRVSIICREEKPDKKADNAEGQTFEQQQQQHSSASVDKLEDIMPSLIANLKHAHSTPNSPHSNRRRGGNTNSAISVNSGSATLHHHGHHHHHHHHHHSRKLSQESINEARGTSVVNSIVNSCQDNVLGAATIPSSHQHSTRYKCSRRHSEGTVSSMVGDRGGGGGGGGGSGAAGIRLTSTGSHHHHHHHQDSNQETGTSISERNSGSLASSRESSTSLSMRSQRRKISVSSHTGGKIPWCGCWGNGCL